MTTRAPVSIILPSRDRPNMLAACLDTVMAAAGPDDELVVVDSASVGREAMAEVTATHSGGRARLIRVELRGVCRARNAALGVVQHPLLLFVDDDVRVDRNWADAFVDAANRHPDVAFFTGRIDVPDDQLDTSRPVAIKTEDEPHVIDRRSEGTLGHSASLAVRRDALVGIGGFDALLGPGGRYPGGDDSDVFDRLLESGFIGRYEPTARAWHDQWRDRRELVRLDWRYGLGSGARLRKLATVSSERERTRRIARELLWSTGVRGAVADLRSGWEFGFAMKTAAVAGTVLGFTRSLVTDRVVNGHLEARRPRPPD